MKPWMVNAAEHHLEKFLSLFHWTLYTQKPLFWIITTISITLTGGVVTWLMSPLGHRTKHLLSTSCFSLYVNEKQQPCQEREEFSRVISPFFSFSAWLPLTLTQSFVESVEQASAPLYFPSVQKLRSRFLNPRDAAPARKLLLLREECLLSYGIYSNTCPRVTTITALTITSNPHPMSQQ